MHWLHLFCHLCVLCGCRTSLCAPSARQVPTVCMSLLSGQSTVCQRRHGERCKDSSAKDDSLSQPLQVDPAKAAMYSQCPVCLGDIRKADNVAYCVLKFCFAFIWWWAKGRVACRKLPSSAGEDSHYKEYVFGLSALLHSRIAMEWACS